MAKLYVGTYAKYNSGSIAGKWLDLEDYSDREEFLTACAALHSDESDPEFMFQDYEDFPKDLYSESSVDARIWDYLEFDQNEREIIDAWLSENTLHKEDLQSIVGSFTGRYASWEAYAEETTDIEGVPAHLLGYIDYEALGRDACHNSAGNVEFNGEIWMFDAR